MPVEVTRPRQTLARASAWLKGVGLHSGAQTAVRLCPAPPETGLFFVDTANGQEIAAHWANVVSTARCTVLGQNGASVQTVEHLLSALAARGVDDARLEMRGGEVPAADGSAAPFAALIKEAGVQAQENAPPVAPLVLERPRLLTGDGGSVIAALPAASLSATVVLDYPNHPFLGTLAASFGAECDYARDIAPARTFGFVSELRSLRARGLAGGASFENALALLEDGYANPPRFSNEPARHKLLDLMGDLALLGRPLQASLFAVKPGHALNVGFARLLSEEAARGSAL